MRCRTGKDGLFNFEILYLASNRTGVVTRTHAASGPAAAFFGAGQF